jgi:uncharacterized membrane protein YgcG
VNASDFDHLDGSDGLGLDPDLTARLRAAAGAEPDLASAHAVLGRRVAGARRRRAVAVTGSAGLSVLLLGAVYAANTGDRGGRISSADAPAVASFGDDDSSTSVTATSVVTTVAPVVVTTLPGASVGSAASADPSSSAATSSSVDGAAVDSVDQSDRELFDVTAASTEVRTVSGIGGSVDVKVENGVLSFASFPIAAPGFTAQVTRDEAGRLEVTFTSGTHLTRLRVRLDGTRLRADRHEEAIPSSSVPGAPTGTAPHTSTGDDDSDDDGSNDDGSNDSNDSNDSNGSNDSNDDDSADSSGSGGSNGGSNDDSNDDQGSGGSGSNSGSGSNRGSGGSGSDD